MAQGKAAVRVWALDKVQNSSGLYYTIDYVESGGELYPNEIIYTYTPSGGFLKHIKFTYDNANTAPVLYTYAAPTQMTKILKRIDISLDYQCADLYVTTVCFGGNSFRTYMFNYESSASSGKLRLSSYAELDEQNVTLPSSATFTYQENTLQVQNQSWTAQTINQIRNASATSNDIVAITGDFNGDGITGIATVHKGFNPDSWGNTITMEISTGTEFRSAMWSSGAVAAMYSAGGSLGNYAIVPGDFNGDGKTDIAVIRRSDTGSGDFWYSSMIVEYSVGNGFNTVNVKTPLAQHIYNGGGKITDYQIVPGDFNGDGRTDFVFAHKSFPNVNGWASWFAVELASDTQFDSQVWITPTANAMAQGIGATSDFAILGGDFNGDGLQDFAAFNILGAPWGSANISLDVSSGAVPDQLVAIQTANGVREDIGYKVSTAMPGAIIPKTGAIEIYPYPPAAVPQSLVETIKTTGDGKTQKNTQYAYYDGTVFLNNARRHRPLGFAKVTETDLISGKYKITQFYRAPSYPTQPLRIDAFLADGTIAATEQFDPPELFPTADLAWYDAHPWPRMVRQRRYSRTIYGGERANTYVRSVMQFDAYSQPTVIQEQYGNNYITTSLEIYNEPAQKIYGLVTDKKVCAVDAVTSPNICNNNVNSNTTMQFLSWERISYNLDPAQPQSFGKIMQKWRYWGIENNRIISLVTQYQYHPITGQLVSVDSPMRGETYFYDTPYGQQSQYPGSMRIRDGGSKDYHVQYDPRFGKVIQQDDYDANSGFSTVVALDTRGREVSRQVFGGYGALERKTSTEYFDITNGQKIVTCQYYGDNFAASECATVITDTFGRERVRVTPTAAGDDNRRVYSAVRTEYDAQWRKIRTSLPYFSDADGNGGAQNWIAYTYDALDRVTKVTQPDGTSTTTLYNNFNYANCAGTSADPCVIPDETVTRIATIDGSGHRKDVYANYQKKPIRVVTAVGTPQEATIDYEYFANGKLKKVTDPQGTTTIGYYPGSWLQASIVDPNAGTTNYFYNLDASAWMLDHTQGNNFGKVSEEFHSNLDSQGTLQATSTHSYMYDNWGRLKMKISGTRDSSNSWTGYNYDETDGSFGNGRLTSVLHHDGTIMGLHNSGLRKKFNYDRLGNVVGIVTSTIFDGMSVDGKGYDANSMPMQTVTLNSYDNLGRKTEITYPDLKKSEIRYIGGTSLTSDVLHDGVLYAHYADYSASGQAQHIAYGSGAQAQYAFDAETLRLGNLSVEDSERRPIQDLDYTFDASGNVASIADNIVKDAGYSFTYDGQQRLAKAKRGDGTVFNYTFDASGNLLTKENRTNYYVPNRTLLDHSDAQTDAGVQTTTFGYSLGGATSEMYYDDAGQRFMKRFVPNLQGRALPTADNPEVRVWYYGGTEIREKWSQDANGALARSEVQQVKYIFGGNGERLAMISGAVSDKLVSYAEQADYWFARSSLANGQSFGGIVHKIGYTAMGCVLYAKERRAFIVFVAVPVGAVLLLLLFHARFLRRDEQTSWAARNPLMARLAPAICFAFIVVNCSGGTIGSLQNGASSATATATPLGVPAGTFFFHANHLQSAVLITNSTGLEETRVHYLPYGEIDKKLSGKWNLELAVFEQTTANATVDVAMLRYTDQELDIETNLMYYNARYYDAGTGNFTTPDSLVPDATDVQSYNRYMYVVGNPIKYNDPSGHCPFCIAILIAALVGAAVGAVAAGTGGDIAGWMAGTRKFDWDAAWKGAIAGALASASGAYVGLEVAAAAAGSGAFATTVGVGITAGYVGGFVGSATGAWMNGASFWDGFGAGMLGGDIGAAMGGVGAAAGYGVGEAWDGLFSENSEAVNNVAAAMRNGGDELSDIRIPRGRITSPFGKRPGLNGDSHWGIDIGRDVGTPIQAVEDGDVTSTFGRMTSGNSSDVNARGRYWGRYTIIDHGTQNGLHVETLYGHEDTIMIDKGSSVLRGAEIGRTGNSGGYLDKMKQWITPVGPHLHYGIRVNGDFIDPNTFDWHRWRIIP